ncbi:MAG: hypothetical protein ACLFTE_02445 [Salinivenus sp.]
MSRRKPSISSGRSTRSGARRRAPRGDGAAASASKGGGSGWSRHGTALPGWTDLEGPKNRRHRESSDGSFLRRMSTGRFALLVLLVAGVFTLYVGHVHATKDLLNQVQEARTENQRLHLQHNRLQGIYDRKTSPHVIYERARELGLEASVAYGPPVSVDD